jgi:hypothetical protein
LITHFQDDNFVVDHASGDVILDLIGFSEQGPSLPGKLLMRFERCGWRSCFLSAFIAHWDSLDKVDLDEIARNYADIPRIDYCEHWPVHGARVHSVTCCRSTGRTSVTIVTNVGTLVLREVDGADPHSDSELLWHPSRNG